jgi:hypothetical protein
MDTFLDIVPRLLLLIIVLLVGFRVIGWVMENFFQKSETGLVVCGLVAGAFVLWFLRGCTHILGG